MTQVLLDGGVADEDFWVGTPHYAGIAYAFLALEQLPVIVDNELLAVGAYEEVGILLGYLVELNGILLYGFVLL